MNNTSNSHSPYSQLKELLALRFHVKHLKLAHQQMVNAQLNGGHRSIRKGRGMEFSEVRAYHPGDDIRHIDWRVSARTQKTHTKVFTEELDRPVLCVLEQTPCLFFGSHSRFKSDQALRVLACIGWCTLNQNDKIGGLVFSHQQAQWLEPKHQKQGLMSLLHLGLSYQQTLTKPQIGQPEDWLKSLKLLQKMARPGQKCYLIGDFLTFPEAGFGILSHLKRHIDINIIQIVDALEMQLPKIGLAKVSDGHTQLQLNTAEQTLRQEYAQAFETQWQAVQQKFRHFKIPAVMITAQEDVVPALMKQGILR